MRLYLATSWRNPNQEKAVAALRQVGFTVYDFKHPTPWQDGFAWTETDPHWEQWTNTDWTHAIRTHPRARRAFASDFVAMQTADACVMLSPSGRSAHIEAGYFVGARKPLLIVLTDEQPPELMYNMAARVYQRLDPAIRDLLVEHTAAEGRHPGQSNVLYNGAQDQVTHWCQRVRESVAEFADARGGTDAGMQIRLVDSPYGPLELLSGLTGLQAWFRKPELALAALPHGPCDRLHPDGSMHYHGRFDLTDPDSLVKTMAAELGM